MTWTIVVPIKPPSLGKTRLALGAHHTEVARALARDTLEAAASVARVVLVTADRSLWIPGVRLVLEDAPTGISAAVRRGLAVGHSGKAAVLMGDLPGLHPEDLREALWLGEQVRLGCVPDVERVGTTMITAKGEELHPYFGIGSFRKHTNAGYLELEVREGSTLRRDVDRLEHLEGSVGEHTRAALAAHRGRSFP